MRRSATTPNSFGAQTQALINAVKYHIRFNAKDQNGETRAERNARFDMEHETPPEPEIPWLFEHVWGWFWEISGQRQSGMNGADPIAWRDIAEWSRLTGNEPSPEELRMLLEMDATFRSAIADERSKKEEKPEPERLQRPPT